MGSMENERMALKLRDPETYYTIWKGDKDYPKHKKEALAEWKKNNSGTEKKREREASQLILRSEILQLEKITNRTETENQELKISFPYITAAHFSERKKLFKLFFINTL